MSISILDQEEFWSPIDTKSMRHLLETLPDQVATAGAMVRGLSVPLQQPVENIVVTGMGGSAIGGDIARAAVLRILKVPLIINRDYELPAFVAERTLLIASSYSGNTEETIAAYGQARQSRASIICVTSGGTLARLAVEDGLPLLRVPGGMPPRAAVGFSTLLILGVLQGAGLIPDITADLDETEGLLADLCRRCGPQVRLPDNPAKAVASSLHGRLIAVYGSSPMLEVAAYRWRGQIEENAKTLAFHHALPEMNHNELVGWKLPADVLRQIAVVFLRDPRDHPQVKRRFDLTREIVDGKCGRSLEVWATGTSPLARLFSTICLGDFVSLYLAFLNKVDPTPVAVIDDMKRRLTS